MKEYYVIVQQPVQVKVRFEAKDDEEAISKGKKIYLTGDQVQDVNVHCTDDSFSSADHQEILEDLLYIEVGKGEAYIDESSILFKKSNY